MDTEKWLSVVKGAGVAMAGFVSALILTSIIPVIPQNTTLEMLAVAVLSVIANVLRKYAEPDQPK